jgi:hypothetical protein
MGPHGWGLAWGRPKNNPEENQQARGAGCYLLRWRWANNPRALPPKYTTPAGLSIAITDPTCLIAERDGAALGERHDALARR